MYTGCVDILYRGRRGPPYRVGHAEPFGTSRYESNLYIVKPPLDPLLIVSEARRFGVDLTYVGNKCNYAHGIFYAAS